MEAAVEVKFSTKPVPAPGASYARYVGGRLTYYGSVEIVDPAAPAPAASIIIRRNDIIAVSNVNEGGSPFLAQVEAFWEDSFTGIAYCRARWIVRASEIPDGDASVPPVSEDEVLLTTVANDIEATNILGLAPVACAPAAADVKPEPEPSSPEDANPEGAAAAGTRRVLRPKTRSSRRVAGRGKRSKNSTLYLRRSFDPFSAVPSVLPSDHPALVQLRERERERESGGSNGRERAWGRWSNGRGSPSKNSDGNGGRVGVERKGLRGARLVLATPRQRSSSRSSGDGGGYCSSSGGSSVSVGGDSGNSSSISDGGFTSEDSEDDLLDDDYDEEYDDDDDQDVALANNGYPRRARRRERRGRGSSGQRAAAASAASAASSTKAAKRTKQPGGRARKAAAASETSPLSVSSLPARPRRLAMPPDESTFADLASADGDGNGGGSPRAAGAGASSAAGAGRNKSLLRGGPLIRAAHAGDDAADGLESPKVEQYPQKETGVGEEHQADIPDMLTTAAERAADREAMGAGEMGGTLVWGSVRDWTADERERLDGYLEQARLAAHAERMLPGVPALISINNGGDRRRKRKIAWAVVAEGEQPEDRGKLRVGCGAGGEALDVSRDEIQPVQVEELAMQALMQEGGGGKEGQGSHILDGVGPALNLLKSKADGPAPPATWTIPQITSLSEALETHFDHDRYARSRGHERHRDEHTDITSLLHSVDGKTPSQVLSFYYRYMATGDALVDVVGGPEPPPVKTRPERKSTRPRTPPPARPSPSPNLRHRPSLRCPTRLAPSAEDSDSSSSGGSYQPRTRQSSRNDRRGSGVNSGGGGGGGGGGSSGTGKRNAGRDAVNNRGGGGGGGGGRPATRQCVDRRSVAAATPEEQAAAAAASCAGSSRPRAIGRSSSSSASAAAASSLKETSSRRSAAAAAAVEWVQDRGGAAGSSGGEGRGYKRSLDDHRGFADGGGGVGHGHGHGDGDGDGEAERVPQRPRWQQEGPRPAIPADAVIVEVSDDDEPVGSTTGPHYPVNPDGRFSNGRAVAVAEVAAPAFVGRSIGAETGDPSLQPPAIADLPPHGSRVYPPKDSASSAYAARASGGGYTDYAYNDYSHHSHHHHHHNNNNHNNNHHDDHHHHHHHNLHQHRSNAYGYGYGYGYGGGGNRYAAAADRYSHHHHHPAAVAPGVGIAEGGAAAAPGRGISMRGAQQQQQQQQQGPVYNGDWGGSDGGGGGRGGGGGGSRGCSMNSGAPVVGYRRHEGLTPMEQCWGLVEDARRDGLPVDRVEYLQGLFRTHEKKPMTYQMLAERTDSCLYDREDIQKAFMGIFAQMKLPESRRRRPRSAYGPDDVSSQVGADYARGGYGVSSRARVPGGHGPGYHYDVGGESASSYGGPSGHPGAGAGTGAAGSGVLHEEGMQRVVAAVTVSKTMASSSAGGTGGGEEGQAQRQRQQWQQHQQQQHEGYLGGGAGGGGPSRSPVALASDMRRLGEGTSMRRVSGDSANGEAKEAMSGEPARAATGGGGGRGGGGETIAAMSETGSAVAGRSFPPSTVL